MENPLSTLDLVSELPQTLIDDLAIGTRTFDKIFSMHGIPDSIRDLVRFSPVLERLVEERKKDIENSGEMLKHHARWGMELAASALLRRVADPATPSSVVVDAYKAFRETAFPKNQIDLGEGGPKFTIIFDMGAPTAQTDSAAAAVSEKDITTVSVVEIRSVDPLGPIPAHIKNINSELEYIE